MSEEVTVSRGILDLLRNANAVEGEFAKSSGLGWLQRRRLGLTWANIRNIVVELQQSEGFDETISNKELAKNVALLLVQDPQYCANYCALDPSFDWEQLLAFIEKLLPIILALIQIFGAI
jgi:hypothetical protein